MSTKLSEQAVTSLILENFPGNEDVMIDTGDMGERSYAELKENLVVPELTFQQLEEIAQKHGDPLLLWIVREVKEGGESVSVPPDYGYTYDADLIRSVLRRGLDDLNAVLDAFNL